MTNPGLERSLHAALMPPGPAHIGTVISVHVADTQMTTVWCGLLSTIPYDYLLKVAGVGHVKDYFLRRLPFPQTPHLTNQLLVRILRLNCLTREYAPLWEELFDVAWLTDDWTEPTPTKRPLNDIEPAWSMGTPLRTDFDRRKALVELDALAALMLGLSADQLCALYRTQFAVLRRYEYNMVFDAHGRKIARDHQAAGVRQQPGDWERVEQWLELPGSVDLGIYEPPFVKPDRETEMRAAHAEFVQRHGEPRMKMLASAVERPSDDPLPRRRASPPCDRRIPLDNVRSR